VRPLSCRPQGRGSSPCRPTGEPETCRAGRRLHPDLTRIRHIPLALVALALLAFGATAAQASYRDAIKDCADDGVLQGTYTKQELRQARKHLPSDLREYSDCDPVLAAALASLANKGKGGRAGGGTLPPAGPPALTTGSGAVAANPQQIDALKQETKGTIDGTKPPPRVPVGGRVVKPSTGGAISTAAHTVGTNSFPVQLLLALIAVGAMGAIAAFALMRHRWPETRRVALRLLRR
jgi:hypothetical protein